MTNLIDRWARERPFLLAFVLMLGVVIPAFIATGRSIDAARESTAAADRAAATAQAQADQSAAVIECLITYAADLTDALQDRDVVSKTARAAAQEWIDTFRRLVKASAPEPGARQTFLDATTRYQRILERLDRTAAINPYPDIASCLSTSAMAVAFALVAHATGRLVCFDRPVTIRGSSTDDVIHGTDKADVIRAFGGDDIVHSGRGNDYICGGRGNDTLNGGQDFDHVRGNRGVDFCIQAEKTRSC